MEANLQMATFNVTHVTRKIQSIAWVNFAVRDYEIMARGVLLRTIIAVPEISSE